jgi:hypothetical protein
MPSIIVFNCAVCGHVELEHHGKAGACAHEGCGCKKLMYRRVVQDGDIAGVYRLGSEPGGNG